MSPQLLTQYAIRKKINDMAPYFPVPPENDEAEVLGIDVWLPEGRGGSEKGIKWSATNLNNYACLVRLRQHRGTIAYHHPFRVPFRNLEQYLIQFSHVTGMMVGCYARDAYQAIRSYIVAYWTERSRTLSRMGVEARKRRSLIRSSPVHKASTSIASGQSASPPPRVTYSPGSRASGKNRHTYHIDNDDLSARLNDRQLMERLKVSSSSQLIARNI